jgi:hypothetical protein
MEKFISFCFAFVALINVWNQSWAAVECPQGLATNVTTMVATGLAEYGFNLTEQDVDEMLPLQDLTEAERVELSTLSYEQHDACNKEFLALYVAELENMGLPEDNITRWMNMVYNHAGELRPPKRDH